MTHTAAGWAIRVTYGKEMPGGPHEPFLAGRFFMQELGQSDVPAPLSGYRLAVYETREMARARCDERRKRRPGLYESIRPVKVTITIEAKEIVAEAVA